MRERIIIIGSYCIYKGKKEQRSMDNLVLIDSFTYEEQERIFICIFSHVVCNKQQEIAQIFFYLDKYQLTQMKE
jgi:hypothetical protein